MKLNHNCVRDVLLFLESESNVITNVDGEIEFVGTWLNEICEKNPKYPQEDIFYTLSKLEEGGYIDMSVQWSGGGLSECCVNFITFAGHEFIEKIRQDSVWQKTLKIAGEVGIFSLKMLAKISESVAGAVVAQILSNS